LISTNNVVLIALNGLAGHALASDKSLSTLPVTAQVLGASLTTVPASLWMQRLGRRAGFSLGAALGILGALMCSLALHVQAFWLLSAGNVVFGVYNAFAQYYRFAAADVARPEWKSRAISLVLAGGIVGGVIGPESSKLTKELLPVPFLGSYLSLLLFALLALVLVQRMQIEAPPQAERSGEGRPLLEIMRQPTFVAAALGAAVGYAVMSLLMTATPLAMDMCHHAYADAALVIEWHVIAMFAPSFVTGSLIQRFGVLQVMLAGCALMFGCVAIALSGVELMHFWLALVLLGVGWNFLYVGGTTLLTEVYTPAEQAKTQGVNDFLIFGAMGVSSLGSGVLVTRHGWSSLNYASLPFLVLASLVLLLLWWKRGSAPQTAVP
jgi:MFS family permease